MGCFHKWLRSRLQSGLTRAELALWHERLSSTPRDLAFILFLGEGVGLMLDAKMLFFSYRGFGSIGRAEAVRKDALAEITLGGGVGVLVDGAGRLVRAVLAVAGVAVAKEFLPGRDSDFPVRLYEVISRYLHQFAYVFHFLPSCT